MTRSKSETTSDQSGLELSNLVHRRTGHVPTLLRERLGVTGTMVLLQRFKVVALAIMSKLNLNNIWWIGTVVGLICVSAVL